MCKCKGPRQKDLALFYEEQGLWITVSEEKGCKRGQR